MSVGVVRACDVVRGRLGQGFRLAFFVVSVPYRDFQSQF